MNVARPVAMEAANHLVDFTREDIDVAIRCGAGEWPALIAQKLFDVDFTPMLSLALADCFGLLTDPAQILPLPWVSGQDPTWQMWLAAAGFTERCDCPRRASLQLNVQLHEARGAMAGEVADLLTPVSSASNWRLARWSSPSMSRVPMAMPTGIYPPARRNRPAIRAFRKFILPEAAEG